MGWVAEVKGHDCVVCPYHGWAFDTDGVLRDVPAAEKDSEFPQKPLIDAFPVEERVRFALQHILQPLMLSLLEGELAYVTRVRICTGGACLSVQRAVVVEQTGETAHSQSQV